MYLLSPPAGVAPVRRFLLRLRRQLPSLGPGSVARPSRAESWKPSWRKAGPLFGTLNMFCELGFCGAEFYWGRLVGIVLEPVVGFWSFLLENLVLNQACSFPSLFLEVFHWWWFGHQKNTKKPTFFGVFICFHVSFDQKRFGLRGRRRALGAAGLVAPGAGTKASGDGFERLLEWGRFWGHRFFYGYSCFLLDIESMIWLEMFLCSHHRSILNVCWIRHLLIVRPGCWMKSLCFVLPTWRDAYELNELRIPFHMPRGLGKKHVFDMEFLSEPVTHLVKIEILKF